MKLNREQQKIQQELRMKANIDEYILRLDFPEKKQLKFSNWTGIAVTSMLSILLVISLILFLLVYA